MHMVATHNVLASPVDTPGSVTANGDSYSSLSCFLSAALTALNDAGLDGIRLLADAGITLSDYEQDGRRAPTGVIAKAWRIVAENTNDPAIGVRAAFRHFNPADWQSLGLAILCSGSIRQALERAVRYFEILSEAANVKLQEDENQLSFVAVIYGKPEQIGLEAMEFGLGALLVLLQEIFPRPLLPIQIELLRPSKQATKDFAKLFGCPIIFGSAQESVSFDIAEANEVLLTSNERLARYQDLFSEQYVARFGSGSTSTRVKREIMRLLPGKSPRLADVADALNVSIRQLQRKLAANQTSFEQLLTDIRKNLSSSYLKRKDKSLSEIAFLLGFSNHSNFSRAFKQWFDISPSDLRKNLWSDN